MIHSKNSKTQTQTQINRRLTVPGIQKRTEIKNTYLFNTKTTAHLNDPS